MRGLLLLVQLLLQLLLVLLLVQCRASRGRCAHRQQLLHARGKQQRLRKPNAPHAARQALHANLHVAPGSRADAHERVGVGLGGGVVGTTATPYCARMAAQSRPASRGG